MQLLSVYIESTILWSNIQLELKLKRKNFCGDVTDESDQVSMGLCQLCRVSYSSINLWSNDL